MNAPKIEMPDLSIFDKSALSELYQKLSGMKGDYARTKMGDYRAKVLAYGAEAVQQAISELVADGIIAIEDDEDGDDIPAPAPKAEQPKDDGGAASALQAAQALIDALAKSKSVDPVEVSRIANKVANDVVTARIKDLPVQKETIVVSGAGEIKIEGLTHEKLDRAVKLAGVRQNILLVGPAGSGKTMLAEQVAEGLKLPFASISCSSGMSESKIFGWLLPVGDSGKFEYVSSDFVSVYENGGVFLFDEIDAADENVLVAVNQALSNGGFFLPMRREKPWVKRHPDFVCIAAANTYGHGADMIYVGRNKLDGATLDRFRAGMVKVEYDPNLERQIVDADILSWGVGMRKHIASFKLRRICSTRCLADFTKQKRGFGLTMAELEESYFQDWSRDELAKIGRL